jgi:hypothetical protein
MAGPGARRPSRWCGLSSCRSTSDTRSFTTTTQRGRQGSSNYGAAFRRRSRRCLPCRSRRHTREQTSASGRPANDRPHSVQSRSTREHPATRSTTFEDPPQSGFLSPAASCSAGRGKGTARKKRARAWRGVFEPGSFERPLPLPTSERCSPVSIGKDRYQNDDEDDPKPGRHSDPFLGKRVDSTRNGWPAAGSKPRDSSALPERFPASCRPCVSLEPSRPAGYGRWGRGSSATLPA